MVHTGRDEIVDVPSDSHDTDGQDPISDSSTDSNEPSTEPDSTNAGEEEENETRQVSINNGAFVALILTDHRLPFTVVQKGQLTATVRAVLKNPPASKPVSIAAQPHELLFNN